MCTPLASADEVMPFDSCDDVSEWDETPAESPGDAAGNAAGAAAGDAAARPRKRAAADWNSTTRKKPKHLFSRGDYVTWMCELQNERLEARVLEDDGAAVVLVDDTSTSCIHTEPWFRARLATTRWRSSVQDGDILRVRMLGCPWQIAKVRHVFRARSLAETVLVVEPAFLGHTVSLPLSSLRLRTINLAQNTHANALVGSGFAFDDVNASPDRWSPNTHALPKSNPRVAVHRHLWCPWFPNHTTVWVTENPPCALPSPECESVRLLRHDNGLLTLGFESELHEHPASSHRGSPPSRVRLGTVRIPVHGPRQDQWANASCVDVFYDHIQQRDFALAATVLYFNMEHLVRGTSALELCAALCTSASHPLYANTHDDWHPVAASVWQHDNVHTCCFPQLDLEGLATSVEQLTLQTQYHESEAMRRELDALRLRVGVWRHYQSEWTSARRVQLLEESVCPVETRLVGVHRRGAGRAARWFAEFEVDANLCGHSLAKVPSFCRDGPMHNLRYASTILDHFTPDESTDAAARRAFAERVHGDWDAAVAGIAAVPPADVPGTVLRREAHDLHQRCMTRYAVARDGTRVPWNLCEGPVWGVEPEDDDAPPPRTGVVLVHNCARAKMDTVARILRAETRGTCTSTPADKGSTLIVCAPTLLYEWQRQLARRGVPSHVFAGVGRRGHAAEIALGLGEVILASYRVLSAWDDAAFFRDADSPVRRVVLDEVYADTRHTPTYMGGLVASSVERVWLLAREASANVLAMALPLLRVRPFASRSQWGADCYTDFRKRSFPKAFLDTSTFAEDVAQDAPSHRRLHRQQLYDVCKTVFVHCGRAQPPLTLHRMRHIPGAPYNAAHRRMLRALHDGLYPPALQGALPPLSRARYQQILRLTELAAWGLPPPMHMLSQKLAVGHYHTDALSHLRHCDDSSQCRSQCLVEAKHVCAALAHGTFAPDAARTCPVCMEVLGGGDPDDNDSPAAAALRRSVVVGACGHMLCGHCADNIHRVAAENHASGDNPYGSSVPLNAACCPICRDPWATHNPLLHSAAPCTRYTCDRGAVYHVRCSRNLADYGDLPLVDALRRLLVGLRTGDAAAKIVVVSHSSELTRFLYVRARSLWDLPCAKLEGNMSAVGRGKALREFDDETLATRVLFASAALLRGVVFRGTRDMVVTECLSLQEGKDVMALVRSSAEGGEMRVHTLYAPVLVEPSNGDVRSVCFVGKPGGGLPVTLHTVDAYISEIDALFGKDTTRISITV